MEGIEVELQPFTRQWRRPRPGDGTCSSSGTTDGGEAEESSHSSSISAALGPAQHGYGCLVCGKAPAKNCARCGCASYCSPQCQRRDHSDGQHKKTCKMLHKLFAEKKALEEQLFALDPPTSVGQFLHTDNASLTDVSKLTTSYYVCLLNLVQILSRDESWRMKKTPYYDRSASTTVTTGTAGSSARGNPQALLLALDIGLNLVHLERADLRARLLIPPIYIELGMLQEAYDYIKYWCLPETTEMIMDQVTMEITTEEAMAMPYLELTREDMLESPEEWIDFDMLYTSCGMVFELALIKVKLSLREEHQSQADELKRQARMLLSAVHRLNPHLLPHLGTWDAKSDQPAAVDELLQRHPPGFDLQCRMGNPGGRTIDEAVAVWQRDMVIWDADKGAMAFLASFSSNLEEQLVALPERIDDAQGKMREEAEALAARLQQENPNLSVDGIMMHPQMAALMAKHLQQSRGEDDVDDGDDDELVDDNDMGDEDASS